MSEIDDLRAMVIAQGRALSELRDEMAFHRGIDSGQSSIYSPHPNISVSTAEFGGGILRLDKSGIQALLDSPDNSTRIQGILFTENFISGTPNYDALSTPYGYFISISNTDTITLMLTANFDDATPEDSPTVPVLQLESANDYGMVRIGPALYLESLTSDPSSPFDGNVWYRSDTDKFRVRLNGATYNLNIEGTTILGDGSELTIASGAVTATSGYHRIDTESDAASDDLDTINGLTTGQVIVIRAENAGRTVVIKNGTGNLQLDGAVDFSLDDVQDTWTGIYDGTNILEISRSDNG